MTSKRARDLQPGDVIEFPYYGLVTVQEAAPFRYDAGQINLSIFVPNRSLSTNVYPDADCLFDVLNAPEKETLWWLWTMIDADEAGMTLHRTEEAALAALDEFIRQQWTEAGFDGEPPEDREELHDEFANMGGSYEIQELEVRP